MMEYNGYVATIEYDDSVDLLHGEVVNTGPYPIVTFEAADVKELKHEFRVSIDDYLSWCEEDGVEPKKPFSGNILLRIDSKLHQRIAASAAESGMSVNSWVKEALEEYVS